MVGHAVPGVVGLQNLYGHFSLFQQFTDEDRNQILRLQRITRYFFLKELLEALLQYIQKIWSQAPHVHRNQRIHINSYTVCLCSICSLYDVLGLHNFRQIVLLIHLADTTSHTTIIRQRILQHKASHARLSAIHQILMDGLEAFLAIVIISIDDDKRSLDDLLRYKHSLTGSPRLCPAFWQSSRDIIDILESIVNSYIMRRANGGNAIADDFFELLLDILADDKYYMIETCLNCIMDGIIHDNVIGSVYRFQLFNSCSEATADSGCHDK